MAQPPAAEPTVSLPQPLPAAATPVTDRTETAQKARPNRAQPPLRQPIPPGTFRPRATLPEPAKPAVSPPPAALPLPQPGPDQAPLVPSLTAAPQTASPEPAAKPAPLPHPEQPRSVSPQAPSPANPPPTFAAKPVQPDPPPATPIPTAPSLATPAPNRPIQPLPAPTQTAQPVPTAAAMATPIRPAPKPRSGSEDGPETTRHDSPKTSLKPRKEDPLQPPTLPTDSPPLRDPAPAQPQMMASQPPPEPPPPPAALPPAAPTVMMATAPQQTLPAVPGAPLTGPATTTGGPQEGRRLPHGLPASLARAATRANKDEKVELTLDPVELGKLRFDFTTTGDRIQVNLSVERGETLDLLRRNADQLRAEFRDAGFDGSSLSFSQWSQPGSDNTPSQSLPDDTDTAEFTLTQPEPAPSRNTAATGHGLDLRL